MVYREGGEEGKDSDVEGNTQKNCFISERNFSSSFFAISLSNVIK